MLRTKLCQSQPLRQRSRDPEKEEQALLFMVQWGEMEDAGTEWSFSGGLNGEWMLSTSTRHCCQLAASV